MQEMMEEPEERKRGREEETENKYEDGRLKPHHIDNYINCK